MKRRPYQSDADVTLIQDFNARAIAATDGDGYLHPGDIPHHLFGGNKLFDPAETLSIWEDEQGVAAWLMVQPRHRCYDAQFRPELRGTDFEREILKLAFDETVAMMRRFDIKSDCLYEEVFRCDVGRIKVLSELGWECTNRPEYILNRARLTDVPEPILPEGYTIRSVRGLEEAAAVAEVHCACFRTDWTAELYRRYMQAPGYAPEHEYVAVAPDGTFAAFTVTWHDTLNRTGLFEPVGTHRDYRRLGLGRAIMLYGMRQMAAEGMEFATVVNEHSNEASRNLYRACGFEPWQELDGYAKRI